MNKNEYFDPSQHGFHYNREERLKNLDPAIKNRNTGGFFKRNKHLGIILADILVIIIVFSVISPILFSRSRAKNIYGCNLELDTMVYDSNVMVSIVITTTEKTTMLPETIYITFNILKTEIELEKVYPVQISGNSNKIYIRDIIPFNGIGSDISAHIVFGEKSMKLNSKIKGL